MNRRDALKAMASVAVAPAVLVQVAEHSPRKREVAGSTPADSFDSQLVTEEGEPLTDIDGHFLRVDINGNIYALPVFRS